MVGPHSGGIAYSLDAAAAVRLAGQPLGEKGLTILERYIARSVLLSGLLVMTILLVLFFFSTFVVEIGDVGKHHYTHLVVIQYCLLLLPRNAYELFPMVTLLGTILGLGLLAGSGELTAIRAAGISVVRIGLAVVKVGLIFILLNLLIGEFLAPQLEMEAKQMRAVALGKRLAVTDRGIWIREREDFIHIRRLLHDGGISEVRVFQVLESGELARIIEAERGEFNGEQWRLEQVRETRFGTMGVTTEHYPELEWYSDLRPDLMGMVKISPEHLSLKELFAYSSYLEQNSLDASPYQLSLWKRLLSPLTIIGMLLLATPFVFGSLRQVGIGQRIMVGSLFGIAFYLFSGIFSRVGLIYDLSPLVSAATPVIVLYMVWYWLSRRVV
ncbi:MAG: LPS export ABC transporter permease LptG [Gammaproteobacteria bacterium]|nr:LPS export ABC transporter permease LptG [Gammaproteobacteria bacterium]